MNKYEKAVIAMETGEKLAKRLESGDVFHGALEHADKLYEKGSLEHSMFVHGYINGLDERFGDSVPCDIVRHDDGTETYLIK